LNTPDGEEIEYLTTRVVSVRLNGALFELFCALIGYVLVMWFRQCHPVEGGIKRAIQQVRTFWNETLDMFGLSLLNDWR
jgi:hypothetical protein